MTIYDTINGKVGIIFFVNFWFLKIAFPCIIILVMASFKCQIC